MKGDLRRLEFAHVERVLDLAAQAEGDGRLRLPGLDIQRSFDWIRVAAAAPRLGSSLDAACSSGDYAIRRRRLPPFGDRAAISHLKKGCYAKSSRVESAAPPPGFGIAGVEARRSLPSAGAGPGSKDQGNVPSGARALLVKGIVADCQ